MADAAISVEGLRKDFGNGDVLSGIDLDIPDGEITLLMGPNGVGKTILLSCIAGGLHADQGEITVLGSTPGAAKAQLSFMLQDAMLVDELTGRENVAFFSDLHPESAGRVEDILDQLEFDRNALEMAVGDYSGGMKRKLELAISLDVEVPLYLLDEPTAALDVTTVETVHSMLATYREEGATMVLSSHLPADTTLADQVAFVTATGISAVGSPERLLDAVPAVVLGEGTADITDYVRGGRLFDGEIHRRGFLRKEVEPASVTAAASGASIEVREPSYTDMFNYYVHLRQEQDD